MAASGRFVRAHDLQVNSSSLLKEVTQSGEPCYITEDGKAKAVIMDIHKYNALMDLVEEAEAHDHEEIGDETRQHISVRNIIRRSTTTIRRRR